MGALVRLGHVLLSLAVLAVAVAFVGPQFGYGPSGGAHVVYSWPSGVPQEAEQWADEYTSAAERHQVPLDVLLAVSWAESAFHPGAESQVGACGLMQLMPETARALGVDCTKPAEAIEGGARYLKTQYDAFGTWRLAFAAYNAGPGAVEQYGGVPPYKETKNYISTIEGYLAKMGDPGAKTIETSGVSGFLVDTASWWNWAAGRLQVSSYSQLSRGAAEVAGAFSWISDKKDAAAKHTGRYALPLDGIPADEADDPHHDYPAWDYGIPTGTQLYAVTAGQVTVIADSSCGNGVRIETEDGWWWTFCHMDKVTIAKGATVRAGEPIGLSGNTGHSTGPHLHLQARNPSGELVCPQTALVKWIAGDLSAVPTGSNCSY